MKFWIKKISLLLSMLFVLSVAIAETNEGFMSRLFAPGPLILGHKDLEGTQCLKCHESGEGVPDSKCLDCHKEIKKFVELKTGYHGRKEKDCKSCHADHKGRDFDSVKFDTKTFDHKLTGFDLTGKHAELKCSECHTEQRGKKRIRPTDPKYLSDKTATCISCHKKDDPHYFKNEWAKKDCNACHGVVKWTEGLKFDHFRDAKYKLEGKHETLKCSECHVPKKIASHAIYKWPSLNKDKCLACHENYHKDNLNPKYKGGQCTTCHTQDKWKIAEFPHGQVTGFALNGKHKTADCLSCHTQGKNFTLIQSKAVKNPNWKGLKTDCLSCHDDFHRFGPYKSKTLKIPNQCLGCHDESSWKTIHNFNHNAHTRFDIDGEHSKLKCAECHLPTPKGSKVLPKLGTYLWPNLMTKTCENCHKSPHYGKFSKELLAKKCSECHITEGWKVIGGKNFNHDKTRFPLTGKHIKTSCTQCHIKNKQEVFKFPTFAKAFCIDCHNNVHNDQFTQKYSDKSCKECHSTENFTKRLPFNHDDTGYILKDSHAKIQCSECHKATDKFYPVKPPKAKGLYLFPDLKKKACLTCHTDVHNGQLDQNCTTCHKETKWNDTKFVHDKMSIFALKGSHKDTKCSECHKPIANQLVEYKSKKINVIKYKPLSDKCSTCHEDVHDGQLSSQCSQCHQETKWTDDKFVHNLMSKYPIKGKHEKLKCSECHKNENNSVLFKGKKVPVVHYKPIDGQCVTCHKDPHKGHYGNQCSGCHSEQESFKVTKDFHKNFSLSGVHFTLQCMECHKEGRKLAGLSQECIFCHKKDDIHQGMLPNCRDCHRQQVWENAEFKHSLTRFPLKGVHRTLECIDCHKSGIYQGLNNECVACHRNTALSVTVPPHNPDSTHRDCKQCHSQFSFQM